ncbi:MAG TPA: hypothetical protein VLE72_02500 [Candidatus Saccharimonadales bacterium]|nr:hypothetical protein [Candidatus Saccharimonadales bacterium]
MDIEDLRSHCLDVVVEINDHMKLLRDYAVSPGNGWLARNELNIVTTLITDLETSIDAIKRAEA